MATIEQVARAFAQGKSARCHNATTDGVSYRLHGHEIARKDGDKVIGNWCGWYTATTANHLREIRDALSSNANCSRATARDTGISSFTF